MARETALKISTVKVNPFKNGCNRIPKESKKKARLKGIPAPGCKESWGGQNS